MTPQRVFKVDLMEIPHIEMTCTSCGGAMVFPVPKEINLSKGVSCIACNQPLCKHDDIALHHLINVLASIGDWKRIQEKRFTLSFSLTQKESA